MNDLQNIIKFYRDCYQTDLKGIRIRNFISTQCQSRFIPSNNDFFHDNRGFPIDTIWAAQVAQILFLNAKEKSLYAGSVFIKGAQNTLGRSRTAFTPMYIHELELKLIDEVYFLEINESYFNPDFIELANNLDSSLNLDIDKLSNQAPANPFGFGNQVLLKEFLERQFKSWDILDLDNYSIPKFNFKSYFSKVKTNINSIKVLSCLMFGVFNKPKGSLGVLNELNQLSEKTQPSVLLEYLFSLKKFRIKKIVRRDIFLPTTLSQQQESAFYSADSYPITQIIGPPGTGKSYTISALAIDSISNNKSVLVVTRNVQSSRVIADIIEQKFGLKGVSIKAFNQIYKRSLISKLSKVLRLDFVKTTNPTKLQKRIKVLASNIRKTEDAMFTIGNSEYEWGLFYANNKTDFFSLFKEKWYQFRKRSSPPIWKLNQRLKELRSEKTRLVKKYIKLKINYDLSSFVRNKKIEFIRLNHALKEDNLTQRDKKLNTVDFELALKALPLWISTTKEVSKCLPLNSGLFDLIIIDEASQCDLASSIPSIYRAKKMVVVGDPHQLKHVSFLSDFKQNTFRKQYGISKSIPDYRRKSLIDCTNDILSNPDQINYLDEHFRSKTEIIRFSNTSFYNNALKLMRSNPLTDSSSSIKIFNTRGIRNKKGTNKIESEQIVTVLKAILKKHSNIDTELIPSIGIISPFSEQVKLLKKDISSFIAFDQLKRHNVLIGTPFHFQGQERDIILISFCVDNNSHKGVINYLNREDVFNVLITRAKNEQLLFTSVDGYELPKESLLKAYLESGFENKNVSKNQPTYDLFYHEVCNYLQKNDFRILSSGTVVSGVMIDLVVLHNNQCFCIDLIGYPGVFEDQFKLEDIRILNRMKVPVFFIPYSSWCLDQDKIKKDLFQFISQK